MPFETLAAIFLLSLVIAPVIVVIRALRRPNFSGSQSLLYLSAVILTRLLWRTGKPPQFPNVEYGAVIVCNHRSSVDPFFVQVCCDRPIRWMVAKEFCEHPLFAWFLTTCDVIPVNRGGIDTAATKAAIRCAQAGGLVGMFPEGRINMSGQFMLPIRPGAGLVATKADVPLIPCYIEGAPYDRTPWSPFFLPARVRIRFGVPVPPSEVRGARSVERKLVRPLMLTVVRRVSELAGKPDYQPQFAGRRWKPGHE
jgi:1-acyl-sn-glycerol-3-phosphate acyltransferase